MELLSKGRRLSLHLPRIVGVLNLTPDSFFPDSRVNGQSSEALARAATLLQEGADIIEIGGESTGPGSPNVSEAAELDRITPALSAIRSAFPECWISVDTWKAGVAEKALRMGADIVNDVRAGRSDPTMLSTVATAKAAIVLMFSKDSSARTTVQSITYENVVETVGYFLAERVQQARAAGIPENSIIVDPGLGHFVSSDPQYSYELLASLRRLSTSYPILVSPSRKSFLAGQAKLPPEERLHATVAASVLGAVAGAKLVRTHDVRSVKQALTSVQGLLSHGPVVENARMTM